MNRRDRRMDGRLVVSAAPILLIIDHHHHGGGVGDIKACSVATHKIQSD